MTTASPAASGAVRGHFQIVGRVQGVCYRMCVRDEALRLGLTGWVRNRPDGSVEAVAEGSREAVLALLAWCRRGPPRADVDHVAETITPATGAFADFSVRG